MAINASDTVKKKNVKLHKLWSVDFIVFICRGPKGKVPLGIVKLLISPVHNTEEKRENAALFLRLGLPSRLAITKTELIENALQTEFSIIM